jgi:hypothetical protein
VALNEGIQAGYHSWHTSFGRIGQLQRKVPLVTTFHGIISINLSPEIFEDCHSTVSREYLCIAEEYSVSGVETFFP